MMLGSKRRVIVLLLLLSLFFCCELGAKPQRKTLSKSHKRPFMIYSSPKTGVNLLITFLDLLLSIRDRHHTHHFPDEPFLDKALANNSVVFVPIRDVRDQMVSAAHFYHKIGRYPDAIIDELDLPPCDVPLTRSQVQNLLLKFIREEWPRRENWPLRFMWSFRDTAHLFLSAPEHVHFVRYENLIGEKGGGDRQKQQQEMSLIAEQLRISLTQKELNFCSDHIFGRSWNFRKGTIGQWKDYFTEWHCDEFKTHFGETLIILGYEIDEEWQCDNP